MVRTLKFGLIEAVLGLVVAVRGLIWWGLLRDMGRLNEGYRRPSYR